MNQIDSFYVDDTMDTGGSRFYHKAVRCPFHNECSSNAWSKAKTTSFICEEAVRKGVFEHLLTSGRHWKREKEAKDAALECEIELVEETQEQREQYRKQIDRIAEQRKRNRDDRPRDDSPDRKKKRDDNVKSKSKGKSKDKKNKEKSDRGGGADAVSIDDDDVQIVRRQPTQVNAQNLGLLIDCLDRSKAALESSQVMLQRAAEAFQQRSQACFQSSVQLQTELNALSAARDCVRDLQVRLQSG